MTCTKGEMAGLPATDVDWPIYTISVDKRTWLPIRHRVLQAGIELFNVRFLNVRVDGRVPHQIFVAHPLSRSEVRRADRGFERVTPDEAERVAGIHALYPGFVPGGYELSGIWVAPESTTDNRLVRARSVFTLQFRSGFDALTISTRRIHDRYYSAGVDPLGDRADPTWSEIARTETTLRSGAFAGVEAMTVVATDTTAPHLWAVKDGVLLTIAGGATAKELLAVAQSLYAYPSPSSQPAD